MQNRYSQCGQDGWIRQIFDEIGETNRYCVEFGAWDGIHLSNTRNLLDQGWDGCMIEGNTRKYADLVENVSRCEGRVSTVNAFVGLEEHNNLDSILDSVKAPEVIDFMSIDVDSIDWHIWKSLKRYRPRVVCIETSLCIPFFIDFVQKPDVVGHPISASPLAVYRLAKSKGYHPYCYCGHDWIFVDEEEMDRSCLEKESYLELYCRGIEYQGELNLPTNDGEANMKQYVTNGVLPLFANNAHHFDCIVNPMDLRDIL